MSLRRTKLGIPVVRVHYTAIPERRTAEWKEEERRKYTSAAAWKREQEIEDEAGGGELVLADTLVSYWKKIVITDPAWEPDPRWVVEGGFDHGKVNATALLRCYSDFEGTLYLCGEYYQPGLEIFEHAPVLKTMADIRKLSVVAADPSIFPETLQQSQTTVRAGHAPERAKSINDLYVEQGIELFSPFQGDRSDVSFMARVMLHWQDLDRREPTLKIVCRNYTEQPQHGLHQYDCPNLLWEMMRARRVKLTAQQLLSRNASEAIVDKDNHSLDACKYIVMSHPEPSVKSVEQKAQEAVKPLQEEGDLTSAMIRYQQQLDAQEYEQSGGPTKPVPLGRRRR